MVAKLQQFIQSAIFAQIDIYLNLLKRDINSFDDKKG